MNRFEIVKRTAEVKWNDRFNIIPGCTEYDEEPEVIKTFDNLGAAIKALYQYKTEINEFAASTGTMYQVTEYAVREICEDQKFDYNMWKSTNNNRYKAQYWIDEYKKLKSKQWKDDLDIEIKTTWQEYKPTINELLNFRDSDKVIQYLIERGLNTNSLMK